MVWPKQNMYVKTEMARLSLYQQPLKQKNIEKVHVPNRKFLFDIDKERHTRIRVEINTLILNAVSYLQHYY